MAVKEGSLKARARVRPAYIAGNTKNPSPTDKFQGFYTRKKGVRISRLGDKDFQAIVFKLFTVFFGNQPSLPCAHDEHHLKTAPPEDAGGDTPIADMRYDDNSTLAGSDCLLYMNAAFVRIIKGTAERKGNFVAVALRLIVELPPDAVQMKQAASIVKSHSIKRKPGPHPRGRKKKIACRNAPRYKPDDPDAKIATEPVQ